MRRLRTLEFTGNMRHLLRYFIENNQPEFKLPYWKAFGNDIVKFRLHFQKHEQFDKYLIVKYEATLKKDIPISPQVIDGVNTKELAARMEKIDWSTDHAGMEQIGFGADDEESRKQAALLPGIMSDLQKLGDASPSGLQAQAAFLYKYWHDTPFQVSNPQVEALKAIRVVSTTICPDFNITASETYTLLNAKALQNINKSAMNTENLKFLADNIKYAGFGENLKTDLEAAIKAGKPEFQLNFETEFNKKPFEAMLNFRKSDNTDMYFFNSYHASLVRNDGGKVEQTFYLNKGKGITAKEAFNLLDGRAVHKDLVTKEGQAYKAWLQLNPEVRDKNNNAEVKQIHENYGYDLKAAVGKLAVAELGDPKKSEELIASLQKGNVQAVTIEKDGSAQKMFIEADPRFKTVKLYDAQMKLVAKDDLSRYQSVAQGPAVNAVKEKQDQGKKKKWPTKRSRTKKKRRSLKKACCRKNAKAQKKGLE